MCGIVGHWSFEEEGNEGEFSDQVDALSHRGPDGSGIEVLANSRVLLGHRRLSIIDLSERGRQPMSNEDGSVWITFNGEIYNYRELRPILEKSGHRFASDTDTEVIVHAYEEWGQECIHRFRGIFAFGIWDDRKEELFLARDHLGVKPLYYSKDDSGITFASEPSAIVRAEGFQKQVDEEALRDFFAYGYVPSPSCIYSGVSKLSAGHTATVKEGRVELRQYWRPSYQPKIDSLKDAVAAASAKIEEVAGLQSVSDVPVGCLLSGGIDSSLLAGLLTENLQADQRKLRTFTIGFDQSGSDEREFAKIAANHFRSRHVEKELNGESFGRQLAASIEAFAEPFDPNGPMPTTYLAELVSDNDTKVVWGGDGGDELFAGYLRYDWFDEYCRKQRGALGAAKRFVSGQMGRRTELEADRFFTYEGVADSEDLGAILTRGDDRDYVEGFRGHYRQYYDPDIPPVVAGQLMDANLYLPDHILCKVDRSTMAYGVEARVPLLDPELVDLAFSIDVKINYRQQERKAVLKRVAESKLPSELLTGRKKGFSSPIGKWSNREFKNWAESVVEDGYLVGKGYVRPDAMRIFRKKNGFKALRSFWMILTAELWSRRWILGEDVPTFSNAA